MSTTFNREAISTALFNLLSGSAGYKTKSRKLVLWDNIQPGDKPAFILMEPGEDEAVTGRGLPTKATLEYKAIIYGTNADENTAGSIELNTLLDAMDVVLTPGPAGVVTLGGLVSHCWKEGRTEKDPGDLDGYPMAVVPIMVLVP